MTSNKKLTPELHSYDLEEIEIANDSGETSKSLQLTIHGNNLFHRALEPIVKVGNVTVSYPEIQLDEKTIIGNLEQIPAEGSEISIEYDTKETTTATDADTDAAPGSGVAKAILPEPFTIKKLKK
jgi:hypothetical protein